MNILLSEEINLFDEKLDGVLFNNKSNELLSSIQLDLEDVPESVVDRIVHKIIEYGVIQYRWALYEEKNGIRM